MNKKTYSSSNWKFWVIALVIALVVILGVNIISASIDDIKEVACDSINLTEPNCTTWWDGLNLTDLNFTEITVEYKTEIHEHNYDYSNDTIYKNYTYSNDSTYSQSFLDSRYVKETEISGKLKNYILKSELNNTINTTIIKTVPSNFTWWNVLTLVEFLFILAGAYVLFKIVKEINYLEETLIK